MVLPTETVYGLGANAEDPAASRTHLPGSGASASHPPIVHIGGERSSWTTDQDGCSRRRLLAEHFAGPSHAGLLRRGPACPWKRPVAWRRWPYACPDHPVVPSLLSAFGGGTTAPSANRFGSVSPTTADRVRCRGRRRRRLRTGRRPLRGGASSRPSWTPRATSRPSCGRAG
ncbi:Sua5/YciO/YrdC/YwlC family protein [Streptomyces tricolor]|nr:Sua5/YciO/YrdC/YwlC family protein [Streptomyces tricolor]